MLKKFLFFQEDMGSPLIHDGYLVGLQSFSLKMQNHPIVYTNIAKYALIIRGQLPNIRDRFAENPSLVQPLSLLEHFIPMI